MKKKLVVLCVLVVLVLGLAVNAHAYAPTGTLTVGTHSAPAGGTVLVSFTFNSEVTLYSGKLWIDVTGTGLSNSALVFTDALLGATEVDLGSSGGQDYVTITNTDKKSTNGVIFYVQ